MQSSEIRQRFLEFFEKRGHAIIKSASLVTSDEKGITDQTLFNTAGMQPLVPYLLGKPYIVEGKEVKRLANIQKCLRTVDIDDIGDNTHATFFEMMGNWSLGDYFKREAIGWSYEFLTNASDGEMGDRGLGLDPKRLYITVFEGDQNAPRDDEAVEIWREVFDRNGIECGDSKTGSGRIFFMPASSNWWEAGLNGPCGPDTEMYYDIGGTFGGRLISIEEFKLADQKRQIVEVWNDVFMQYEKRDGKIVGKLPKPSVDTGAGLERLAMTMQGVDNIYDTDLLKPIVGELESKSTTGTPEQKRIIADHLRASVFIITDGVIPSNTDRGYILRRLLRRAIRNSQIINLKTSLSSIVDIIIKIYEGSYRELASKKDDIKNEIEKEVERFNSTIGQAVREFNRITDKKISGIDAFRLFSSYGMPIDMTVDLAKEQGKTVDVAVFEKEFKRHQELSRTGAEQRFRGGLADTNNPMIVRYHTATHLLHQALHDVLGEGADQKGSNITAQRLRFDFTHDGKMTDDEKKRVEDIVNQKISEDLPVNKAILPKTEAEKTGARHFFGEKYGDQVSIYYIGDDISSAYSKEFCGGPHVASTGELSGPEGKWRFRIIKEEAVAQGVRRIKAVFE